MSYMSHTSLDLTAIWVALERIMEKSVKSIPKFSNNKVIPATQGPAP